MACNSRNSCGTNDLRSLELLIRSIILELLNDGTLQAGLKDCEGDWLGKGRKVVLCDALADLLCDLINEGKLCVPRIAAFTTDCVNKTITISMSDGSELTADLSCIGGGGVADGNTTITGFNYDRNTGVLTITESNGRSWPVTISITNTKNKAMEWQPSTQVVAVVDTEDNKVSVPVVFDKADAPTKAPYNTPAGHFIGKSASVLLGEPDQWMYFLTTDGRRGRVPVFFDTPNNRRIQSCPPILTDPATQGFPFHFPRELGTTPGAQNALVVDDPAVYQKGMVDLANMLTKTAGWVGSEFADKSKVTWFFDSLGWIDVPEAEQDAPIPIHYYAWMADKTGMLERTRIGGETKFVDWGEHPVTKEQGYYLFDSATCSGVAPTDWIIPLTFYGNIDESTVDTKTETLTIPYGSITTIQEFSERLQDFITTKRAGFMDYSYGPAEFTTCDYILTPWGIVIWYEIEGQTRSSTLLSRETLYVLVQHGIHRSWEIQTHAYSGYVIDVNPVTNKWTIRPPAWAANPTNLIGALL